MIDFLICLIISIMLGYGLAIVIVEKGKEWPIRPWRIRLQLLLRKIHYKLPRVLKCTTCSSFYTCLISDCIVCVVAHMCGVGYFFWPFSGIICAAGTWTVIEVLNSIDKEQNINVFIGDNNED